MDILGSYIVLCLIFGTTFIAIKIGVIAGIPPILFAGLRFTIAGVIALILAASRRLPLKLTRVQFGVIVRVGLTGTTAIFGALFWAERFLSPGVAATVGATLPMFVVFLRAGGHRMSPYRALGLVAGLLGVGLVLSPTLGLPSGHLDILAIAVLLAGEVAAGWGSVQAEKGLTILPAFVFNGYQMLLGGVALLALSTFEGIGNLSAIPVQGWAALAYLVIVGSVIGWSLYYWLIARTGAVFPSTWTYIAPAISTLLGIVFLHEALLWSSLAGVALVLVGAALADLKTWREALDRIRRRAPGDAPSWEA